MLLGMQARDRLKRCLIVQPPKRGCQRRIWPTCQTNLFSLTLAGGKNKYPFPFYFHSPLGVRIGKFFRMQLCLIVTVHCAFLSHFYLLFGLPVPLSKFNWLFQDPNVTNIWKSLKMCAALYVFCPVPFPFGQRSAQKTWIVSNYPTAIYCLWSLPLSLALL